jgi:hypothetical protein
MKMHHFVFQCNTRQRIHKPVEKAIFIHSLQPLHQLLNPYQPLIHILNLHQNFQPVLAGELVFAAALGQLDDFQRVDGRVGDELHLDAVGTGVDAGDAERFGGVAQVVTVEQGAC